MTENLGISGRVSRFFVASQLTPLVALVAMLLGVFAVLITPREEEPQINVTMANVLIAFPGASAKQVEQSVAVPAEQVLSQIALRHCRVGDPRHNQIVGLAGLLEVVGGHVVGEAQPQHALPVAQALGDARSK